MVIFSRSFYQPGFSSSISDVLGNGETTTTTTAASLKGCTTVGRLKIEKKPKGTITAAKCH
jgi:hypothetical protein